MSDAGAAGGARVAGAKDLEPRARKLAPEVGEQALQDRFVADVAEPVIAGNREYRRAPGLDVGLGPATSSRRRSQRLTGPDHVPA